MVMWTPSISCGSEAGKGGTVERGADRWRQQHPACTAQPRQHSSVPAAPPARYEEMEVQTAARPTSEWKAATWRWGGYGRSGGRSGVRGESRNGGGAGN